MKAKLLALLCLLALTACTIEPFHVHTASGRDVTSLGASFGTKSTQSDLVATLADGTRLESHRTGHDETRVPAAIANSTLAGKATGMITGGISAAKK